MIAKQRIANCIAMLIGGVILTLIGFGGAKALGGWFALFPGFFGVLGLFWIVVAIRILVVRDQTAIAVTPTGIELPTGSVFGSTGQRAVLEWQDIASVVRSDSLRGRGVEIRMKDGRHGFVQVRHYCEIEDFLEMCRKQEAQIAQPDAGQVSSEAAPSASPDEPSM